MGPRDGPADVVEGNSGIALGPHQGTISVQRDGVAVGSVGVSDSVDLWLLNLAWGWASWQGNIRTDALHTQQPCWLREGGIRMEVSQYRSYLQQADMMLVQHLGPCAMQMLASSVAAGLAALTAMWLGEGSELI